jgi:hypothetical protein
VSRGRSKKPVAPIASKASKTDRELAEALMRRLRGVRCFQLFLRKLGPEDSIYASALACDADGYTVEAKASAEELDVALVMLLANLDQAVDPDVLPTEHPTLSTRIERTSRGELAALHSKSRERARSMLPELARSRAIGWRQLAKHASVSKQIAKEVIAEFVADGRLRCGRRGYVASERSPVDIAGDTTEAR